MQEVRGFRRRLKLPVLVEGRGGVVGVAAVPNVVSNLNVISLALVDKLGLDIETSKGG